MTSDHLRNYVLADSFRKTQRNKRTRNTVKAVYSQTSQQSSNILSSGSSPNDLIEHLQPKQLK